MATDDHSADVDRSEGNNGEQDQQDTSQDQGTAEGQGTQEQDQSQGDYQAKLNATNRFLKKEGYEFKEGRWQKAQQSSGEGSAPIEQEQSAQAAGSLSREEAILFAKGFTEAEVEKMKKVAAVEGIKLTDVPANDIFTAWKAKQDAEARDREAQLGASRGGRSKVHKTFETKGLSDEEHRALFQEKIGK